MSWIAVGIGGAAGLGLAGSIIGSNAAGSASDKQTAASQYATDVQKQQYDQTRQDQAPWRDAGGKALGDIANGDWHDFGSGDFHQDPGYDFRMQEGQKALERSAAARGGLQSGGTMRALTRYGQDYASGEYQNAYNRFNNDRTQRFNRLSSVAGIGQQSNNQVAQAGQNYASAAGQNAIGAANAQGAAGVQQGQIWGNEMGSLGKTWMDYSMMNKTGIT